MCQKRSPAASMPIIAAVAFRVCFMRLRNGWRYTPQPGNNQRRLYTRIVQEANLYHFRKPCALLLRLLSYNRRSEYLRHMRQTICGM